MPSRQLKESNLNNLTQLWQRMGTIKQADSNFHISASWPYRCWLNSEVNNDLEVGFGQLSTEIKQHYFFPIWDSSEALVKELQVTLKKHGYVIAFKQTAMYLDMKDYLPQGAETIELILVQRGRDVKTWADIGSQAFSYVIDCAVIEQLVSIPELELFLVFGEGHPIATALLYRTGDIFGIHQLGVLPQYRGLGLAGKLMMAILQRIKKQDGRYVMLQASKLGLGLYRRLGFIEQFSISNYQRRL